MQGFVQGPDRQQTTLLPECFDDWVDEGNPVRAVDVFVDALSTRRRYSTARTCRSPAAHGS
jgi:transposase